MAVRFLSDDELARVKREALDNVLAVGAEPYISIRALYALIQDYVQSSALEPTTSATAVTAAGATTLTLADATGLAAQDKVVLDVDAARETVTVRNVSGNTISVVCRRLHGGTYPVEKESALTLVRGCLSDLAVLQDKINDAVDSAGVKRVDEVEFFGPSEGRSVLDELRRAQHALRLDLARMCGLTQVLAAASGRGSNIEVY